ncbi:RebB family R body protein [Planctomycetota bacterium]|nr:RebB family R body protein [Planctomycetota bacterium]
MPTPTEVNSQITDAITQTNVKVVAEAPAMAMGSLYQTMAHATQAAALNATTAQANAHTILQATTTQGVALLYGIDTAATAVGIAKILKDSPDGKAHLDGLIQSLSNARDTLAEHDATGADK